MPGAPAGWCPAGGLARMSGAVLCSVVFCCVLLLLAALPFVFVFLIFCFSFVFL
jgi:hypothetical protein